jgi:fatty-acyl-CoA synthase
MDATPENNVASWITRRAEASADQPAVADDLRRLDYAGFEQRIRQLAGWLRALGVAPGDRVGILLGNCSAYLEALFAAARIGAIAVPINTRLSAREVCFLLDDCSPKVLIRGAALRELALQACATARQAPKAALEVADDSSTPCDYEAALEDSRPCSKILPVSGEAPMILMYTSGTTGRPKGALLPHRKALYNSRNAEIYFGIERSDRVLVVAPLFHSLGLQILALPVLYCGGSLVLQPRFDPEELLLAVEREAITYLGGVPTLYQRLLERIEHAHGGGCDLGSLRFLFTAGASAPRELIDAYGRCGLALVQGYGQTESSTLTCCTIADAGRKAGSVGLPVEHAELRIIAPDSLSSPASEWREVDVGETGEIVVRGPIVMLGYWKRPEDTAATVCDGWLRTGDLARRDTEGFLTLVGRLREMFISGGENVYPAEIETAYAEHPALREIAVVGVSDARWGETGRAHVVLQPGATVEPAELAAWGRQHLAGFKIPTHFVFEAELPRTASGKVQKDLLTDPATRKSLPSRT